ncbi:MULTISPECIES: hypothetical protein [Staphylococcus]|uniref:Phage protein n=1 Tax=Staphylococcus casei TaxID=201828 RepID=A0ABZ2WCF7_9STAP|nr:hypothetical protein [Staphylococcus succinus]PTJ85098.1 hypothetical protein BU055_02085 [Staphylococcus succinus]
MILISEETVTIRYTVKFEKRVTERQKNNETRQDFIDRIADDLFKHPNDYTDGTVIDIDNVEER